jgi:Kef-type K+ transport system membrane component KefB
LGLPYSARSGRRRKARFSRQIRNRKALARRAAISTSAAGIVVPFACGFALGELLPAAMLPKPDQRIITSLFLGTALSIASVKIMAMVVREMGFMRRNVGITLIASAIIDDTVGWIVVAIISGRHPLDQR